jgi:hypothetical protein
VRRLAQSLDLFSENENLVISLSRGRSLVENFCVIDSLIKEKSKISASLEIVDIMMFFGFSCLNRIFFG